MLPMQDHMSAEHPIVLPSRAACQPPHLHADQQDIVAGDGTTSVVVLCGALLKKALELLERGIHPTVVSDSFSMAVAKAVEVRRLPLSSNM